MRLRRAVIRTTNPNDASAYFNLGNLYLLEKRYDNALVMVERGLSKRPSSPFGNFLRGSLLAQAGNTLEAEKSLRRSLELDPAMAQTHLALVNLFLQANRGSDAIVELRTFLKQFPDHQFAPKAREVLKRLETPTAPLN